MRSRRYQKGSNACLSPTARGSEPSSVVIRRWLLTIALLSGTVVVLVPLLILWAGDRLGHPIEAAHPGAPKFWLALILAVCGGVLGFWTASLFIRFGDGTAAPWDPPTRFVVRGPYRHVRNPMIIGAFMLLVAEALFFQSWALAAWAGLFLVGNAFYFLLVEEPALRRRFGNAYLDYCKNVGRWVPRLCAWRPNEVEHDDNKGAGKSDSA